MFSPELSPYLTQALLTGFGDPVFVLGRGGEILAMSPQGRAYVLELWGEDPRPGSNILEYGVAAHRAAFEAALAAAFDGVRTDRAVEIEYPSGRRIPYEVSYVPVAGEQGVVAALFIARDVTRLNDVERELALFEHVLGQLHAGVAISDARAPDAPIVYVNGPLCEMTGYAPDELLRRNMRFMQGEDREQPARRALREAIDAGEPVTVTIRNYRKSGELFHNLLSVAPVAAADGSPRYLIAIHEDITRTIDLERMLQRAQKMEALGELAAGVAHDFNNMLAVIEMNAELAQLTGGPSQELERVSEAIGRAGALTRKLLTFARPELGAARVLELGAQLESLRPMLESLCSGRPEPCEVVVGASPAAGAWARLERSEFEQIAMNLAINALHALEGPGRVELGVRERAGRVELVVRDDGVGMAPEVRERLFEPFFTTRAGAGGTGLGLAVVYGLVTARGGGVDVESAPGEGATFTVWLPRASPDPDEPARAVVEAAALARSARALSVVALVGEPALRRSIQLALLAAGYDVLAPASTTAALALSGAGERADVVVASPALAGATTARAAASFAAPVVALLGGAGDAPGELLGLASRRLGAPFGMEALVEAIHEAAGQGGTDRR